MKYEHRAIIESAAREGKAPSELAKELLGHDLLKAMVTAIAKPAVTFSKMSEQQQEAVIEDLKKELLPAISTAIGVIVSQNSHAVRMKLKKLATGPSLQLTGSLDKAQDHIHELMDLASDNSDVLVILHERDYVQGLDSIKGEKDQKDLPLDKPAKAKPTSKKAEPKPVELTEGLISQAVEFVTSQQNGTLAGIQNQFKIDNAKGRALLAKLGELGLVGEPDERGDCRVIIAPRNIDQSQADQQSSDSPKYHAHDLEADDQGLTLFCTELVNRAASKVKEEGKVSRGALCITFDLDDAVAQQVIDQLKADGVIDADEQLVSPPENDDSQME